MKLQVHTFHSVPSISKPSEKWVHKLFFWVWAASIFEILQPAMPQGKLVGRQVTLDLFGDQKKSAAEKKRLCCNQQSG